MDTKNSFSSTLSLLIAMGVTIGSACNRPSSPGDAGDNNRSTSSTSEPPSQSADSSCYLYVNGRDSAWLQLSLQDGSVSGTLRFDNYEIDGSRGTVHGDTSGDTLFVQYDYQAEGMRSVTEEAFLQRGGALIRGAGDREEHENVYRFTDRATIDFTDGQIFQPVSCNKN
ncbi:hypothetical protein ACFOET_14445 [Parapedobacter deserti]|uniref:Lipoprotein n=1 Tax=Parapedobacter deserti TaxID=1912957 RepID=A0ABV7JR94_9SPHI